MALFKMNAFCTLQRENVKIGNITDCILQGKSLQKTDVEKMKIDYLHRGILGAKLNSDYI